MRKLKPGSASSGSPIEEEEKEGDESVDDGFRNHNIFTPDGTSQRPDSSAYESRSSNLNFRDSSAYMHTSSKHDTNRKFKPTDIRE